MAVDINPTTNIPTSTSTASQWVLWHQALAQRYGKATANTLFLEAWQKRQSVQANTSELRSYLSDQGIKIEEGYFGYVADFWDEATGMLTLGSKAGLYGGAVLLLLIVVPVFILFFNIARKPQLIAQFAPAAAAAA